MGSISSIYPTIVGLGATASLVAGSKASKDGGINFGVSTSSSLALVGTSAVSNTINEAQYEQLVSQCKVETTQAYVQQLSDEELELALTKFDLLEKEDKNDVKVL